MKKGFTIVEVSILFVIFLIVAFLVAPMSLDETMQAKNISRWKVVQSDFINIANTINLKISDGSNYQSAFDSVMSEQVKTPMTSYRISYMNGRIPVEGEQYYFKNYATTQSGATIAYKFYPQNNNTILGMLMYDINGQVGPNVWGKDVFGLNIYSDKIEPFCKNDVLQVQKNDCSKIGSGLCCSNYYLIGGSID